MKSNSNYVITKAVVDPISQELTSVYINGEEFSNGDPDPTLTDYSVGIFVATNDATDYKLIAFQGTEGILIPEVNNMGWHFYEDLEVIEAKESPLYSVTISGIKYGCDNVNLIRLFDRDISNL